MLRAFAVAALLAASPLVLAQPADKGGTPPQKARRFDCSQAKDPKACEERRQKIRAAHDKAQQACQGKQGPEHRDCMRTQMCAQAKDPAQCEARAKAQAERRKQRRQSQPQPQEKK